MLNRPILTVLLFWGLFTLGINQQSLLFAATPPKKSTLKSTGKVISLRESFVDTSKTANKWETAFYDLRDKGEYDAAIDCLRECQDDPNCPVEWKEQIDLQLGLLLLEMSEQVNTETEQIRLREQAKETLLRFLKFKPDPVSSSSAYLMIGKIFLDDARTVKQQGGDRSQSRKEEEQEQRDKLKQGQRDQRGHNQRLERELEEGRNQNEGQGQGPEEAQELLLEHLGNSAKYLKWAEEGAYKTAKELKYDPQTRNDAVKRAKRDRAYAELLESRIQLARVFWEQSKSVSPESPEYKAGLAESAEKFHDLAVKYRNFPASLESKLYEAQVLFELGQFKEVRQLLGELTILPRSNEFFETILDESLCLILSINLLEPTVLHLADSCQRIEFWLESINKGEQDEPKNSRINFLAGKTYLNVAKQTRGSESRAAKRTARKFLIAVAPESPEYQEAQQHLTSLGSAAQESESEKQPKEKEAGEETDDDSDDSFE
ncbi:MAG: hypothetical protein ACRC10_01525 [Thermoguttaceae bacterium]